PANQTPTQPVTQQPVAPTPAPAPPVATPTSPPTSGPATGVSTPPTTPPVPEPKKPEGKTSSTDPLGDLASQKLKQSEAKAAAASGSDGFDYFVQAGAFRTQADADAQRAKLAMLGWEARVSEREQNGRTVFRVRVGPFGKRDDAEQLKGKLDGAGVDSALVRVQR
ncbi:MAG: SPOR domain-containing protein, partial [Comamonas sp.]